MQKDRVSHFIIGFLFVLSCSLAAGCGKSQSVDDSEPAVLIETSGPKETLGQSETTQAKTEEEAAAEKGDSENPAPKVRKFRFIYAAVINELAPGATARVWLPVAENHFEQDVNRLKIETPAPHRITTEKKYGNKLIYFEARADSQGEISLSVEYLVTRRESLAERGEKNQEGKMDKYLASSRFMPNNNGLLGEIMPQPRSVGNAYTVAHQLYEAVDTRMRYEKPEGGKWGRGDAIWACRSGFGNCTDFHSLFISTCRESGIPAKFEIGFPLPGEKGSGEVGGYHCWAKFAAKNMWLPVDISEADKNPKMKKYYFGNLTPDRVTFSVGRDLELDPPQKDGPVNFLVYPYVEVDGKQHKKFIKNFRYEDVE